MSKLSIIRILEKLNKSYPLRYMTNGNKVTRILQIWTTTEKNELTGWGLSEIKIATSKRAQKLKNIYT